MNLEGLSRIDLDALLQDALTRKFAAKVVLAGGEVEGVEGACRKQLAPGDTIDAQLAVAPLELDP